MGPQNPRSGPGQRQTQTHAKFGETYRNFDSNFQTPKSSSSSSHVPYQFQPKHDRNSSLNRAALVHSTVPTNWILLHPSTRMAQYTSVITSVTRLGNSSSSGSNNTGSVSPSRVQSAAKVTSAPTLVSGQVSRVYEHLGILNSWMPTEEVRERLPRCFKRLLPCFSSKKQRYHDPQLIPFKRTR